MPVNYAGTASDQRIVLLHQVEDLGTGQWYPVAGGYYTFAVWSADHVPWADRVALLQWSADGGLFTVFDVQGIITAEDVAVSGVPIATGHVRCGVIGAGPQLNATLSGVTS